jgi:hypothetical protein
MYQATTPCPKCGAQNLRGTWVCAHCGSTLLIYCPHCRAANVAGSKFCQSCGQLLSGSAYPASGQAQSPPQQPPPYAQQPPGYQQPPYGQYDYQQPYQQYPGGYPPGDYQPAPQAGGDIIGKAQVYIDAFINKTKQVVATTNPMLLSSLVILIVGMIVFLVLAVQLGWIKTAATTKTATVKDTTPPVISVAQVKPGNNNGAIIYWVTDKPSSSQVQYGIWPNYTTFTPIQSDPTTGANTGVLVHEVGLSSLLPNSTYQYRCISIDKSGNKAMTPDLQFQTTQ